MTTCKELVKCGQARIQLSWTVGANIPGLSSGPVLFLATLLSDSFIWLNCVNIIVLELDMHSSQAVFLSVRLDRAYSDYPL